MQKAIGFVDTTIGKKAVMAVTGLVLFGFVIGHMAGHLQMFLGPDVYNAYAHSLKASAPILWGVRSLLLISVVLHVWAAVTLVARTNAARPVGYRMKRDVTTTYAARTMKYSGPLLLAFIVFHVMHFTAPGIPMGNYVHDPEDPYSNFVNAFHIPWVTLLYVVAMSLLALHLYHGAWSFMQTLGLNHPKYNEKRNKGAKAAALAVAFGFAIVPIAVLLGLVHH
jgi:succinate dehydrogenase / fumarate reductase cytochrome b subunit